MAASTVPPPTSMQAMRMTPPEEPSRAMAWERVTLYGLTVADKRAVHYGPIAPAEARELLIREGLIAGKYRQPPPFLKHNQRMVRELEERYGWTEKEIRGFLGENLRRVYEANWE